MCQGGTTGGTGGVPVLSTSRIERAQSETGGEGVLRESRVPACVLSIFQARYLQGCSRSHDSISYGIWASCTSIAALHAYQGNDTAHRSGRVRGACLARCVATDLHTAVRPTAFWSCVSRARMRDASLPPFPVAPNVRGRFSAGRRGRGILIGFFCDVSLHRENIRISQSLRIRVWTVVYPGSWRSLLRGLGVTVSLSARRSRRLQYDTR